MYNGETERVVLQNYGDLESRVAELLGAPASGSAEGETCEYHADESGEAVVLCE